LVNLIPNSSDPGIDDLDQYVDSNITSQNLTFGSEERFDPQAFLESVFGPERMNNKIVESSVSLFNILSNIHYFLHLKF